VEAEEEGTDNVGAGDVMTSKPADAGDRLVVLGRGEVETEKEDGRGGGEI